VYLEVVSNFTNKFLELKFTNQHINILQTQFSSSQVYNNGKVALLKDNLTLQSSERQISAAKRQISVATERQISSIHTLNHMNPYSILYNNIKNKHKVSHAPLHGQLVSHDAIFLNAIFN